MQEFDELRKKKLKDMLKERAGFSDNIIKEFTTKNLSNFYDRCRRELGDFRLLFSLEPEQEIDNEFLEVNENFVQVCQMFRVTPIQVRRYYRFLENRVKEIESVINSHFNLIKETLLKQMKEDFEREWKRKRMEGLLDGEVKKQIFL